MARYLAHPKANPPHIERLPRGTPRTEGQSLKEAKQIILDWLRYSRDIYAKVAKIARRLDHNHLSLADLMPEGIVQRDMSEDEYDPEEGIPAVYPEEEDEGDELEEEEQESEDAEEEGAEGVVVTSPPEYHPEEGVEPEETQEELEIRTSDIHQ